MIEIELPFPPTINHSKMVGRIIKTCSGKMYQHLVNKPETNRFYFEVWMKVRHEKLHNRLTSFENSKIAVEVDFYPPHNRKWDIDNRCKVLLDAMQKAELYKDDCQIHKLILTKKTILKDGKSIVRIESI